MARNQSFITNWTQYLAARGLYGFLHSFDVRQNLETAAMLGSILYRIHAGRRERALEHVRDAFPHYSPRRIEWTVERSYQHMIQLFMVDAIAAPKFMTADGWPNHMKIGNVNLAIDHLLRKEPAVLITGHIGNWELVGSFLGVLGYPIHALARPLDNPLLNRWLMEMREARGTRVITKWGAITQVQQILRQGQQVAFIADQNAGDQGLFVPFFGRLASSYKSIALLAMRYRIPIIAGYAKRIGLDFTYEVNANDFIRPEDWAEQPDPIFYLTARYNRAIELMVRDAPEQYLWVHRRWKSRPRFEREGRPFPKRLRAKLETLPWMTQEELDKVIASSSSRA